MNAGHSGAIEHQPLRGLWAGRTPERVTLDTTHRLGVGLNLHQPHCGPARHALHHAPRNYARTWKALAYHAVKPSQRIVFGVWQEGHAALVRSEGREGNEILGRRAPGTR